MGDHLKIVKKKNEMENENEFPSLRYHTMSEHNNISQSGAQRGSLRSLYVIVLECIVCVSAAGCKAFRGLLRDGA